MTTLEAFHAVTRFGFGAKGDELKHVASDPRGWLIQQIEKPVFPDTLMKSSGGEEAYLTFLNANQQSKEMRKKDAKAAREVKRGGQTQLNQNYKEMIGMRLVEQAHAEQSFTERLVWFWSNHFTISVQKKSVVGLALQYEREVIRKHLNGHFGEMLLAVVKHPAMLTYLDNNISIGPNSVAGKQQSKRGLNENLGREILELHTLGVHGGYSQADVIALAKIITGWSIDNKNRLEDIRFKFIGVAHEPGHKTLLGKRFGEGQKEGERALDMLAKHPSTAKFVATKLARYFIADNPPASAVEALTKTFLETDGHLPSITKKLVSLKEAWEDPLSKFKNPYDYAVSILRVADLKPKPNLAVRMLQAMYFNSFDAGSPAGFDDDINAWLGSDAVMKRIELAHYVGQQIKAKEKPLAMAQRVFADALSAQTAHEIEGAETAQQGYALLLSCPEFQRR